MWRWSCGAGHVAVAMWRWLRSHFSTVRSSSTAAQAPHLEWQQPSGVNLKNPSGDRVEEIAVVRDRDHAPLVCGQEGLEPRHLPYLGRTNTCRLAQHVKIRRASHVPYLAGALGRPRRTCGNTQRRPPTRGRAAGRGVATPKGGLTSEGGLKGRERRPQEAAAAGLGRRSQWEEARAARRRGGPSRTELMGDDTDRVQWSSQNARV
eukprot:3820071-Prymnesium_polylepis.2